MKASVIFLFTFFFSTSLYAQEDLCPSVNLQAKDELINYLNSEETIKNLKERQGIEIDSTSYLDVRALKGQADGSVCSAIMKHATWLKDNENYSFFEFDKYYVSVIYKLKDGNFERGPMSFFDRDYNYLFFVIDI